MRRLLYIYPLLFILFFTSAAVHAQTILVNGATDGGFETGITFPLNGWTAVNSASGNRWFVGTVPTGKTGLNCAYISNNATGLTHNYTNTAAANHFYRDITIPATDGYVTMTFNWKCLGESTVDYMRVYMVSTATTPVAGTALPAANLVGSSYYNLAGNDPWQSATVTFCATGTVRIVFSWINDASNNNQPPIAIDNINIVSSPGPAVNDLPCNAIPLSLGVTTTGNNQCAGNASEPAAPACWTNSAGQVNTVWYSVVCPASGQLSFRTGLGTLTNTQIAVYQGTCSSLTAVAGTQCNDDVSFCGNTQPSSELIFSGLTPGNTYYIAIDGYQGQTGDFAITAINGTGTWPVLYGPDCSAAIPVCNSTTTVGNPGFVGSGNYCDYPGNMTGCPAGSCIYVGERNSVWYSFTTNAAGTISFTLTPNVPVDYDWALYDVTGIANPCAQTAANTILPIRCSYSGATTPTGMGAPGTEACDGTGGTLDAWASTLATTSGSSYLLLVSNFSTSTFTGFNINWNASPINYTGPGTFTWTGAVSSDWNNASNWGGCGVPDCTRDVVIFSGPTNQPVIPTGVTVSCRSITIQPSASVTLAGTAQMNVCGDFINNGVYTAAATSTTNFIGTGTQNVNGNNSGANKFGNFLITKTTGTVVLNQTTDIGGNLTMSNNTSILNSNNQYVRIAGNFNNFAGNTTYAGTGTTGTLEFNGTGAQTYNQGSSQLDLNFVLMNHTGTGVTLSTDMFIKTATGTLTLTQGKIITNAFRVDVANSAPASVSTGTMTSYVNGNLYRTILPAGGAYNFPVGTATLYERALVTLSTNTYTRLQSRFDPWPVLPNILGSTECTATYSLPSENMGFWTISQTGSNTGTYNMTLYCNGATNIIGASGWTVEKAASSAGPWGLNGGCVASTATVVNRNNMNGFSVFAAAQSPTPLPVEITSFDGHPDGVVNVLTWVTESETNNDYFVVEKSADGFNYEEMERVKGAGNSNTLKNYSATDEKPFVTTYYRLRQVDFNGDFSHYGPIAITNNEINELTVHNIYPNPADQDFFIDFYAKNTLAADIYVYDALGKEVYQKTIAVSGITIHEVDAAGWQPGVYVVKVINEDEHFQHIQRVIIK